MKTYHYTYLLTFRNLFYIGQRSTTVLPEQDDCYLSSSALVKHLAHMGCDFNKTILQKHENISEALAYESVLLKEYKNVPGNLNFSHQNKTEINRKVIEVAKLIGEIDFMLLAEQIQLKNKIILNGLLETFANKKAPGRPKKTTEEKRKRQREYQRQYRAKKDKKP